MRVRATRVVKRRHCFRIAIGLLSATTTACAGFAVAQSGTTIWDGVYAEAQAERGATVYRAACSSCHSEDLRGNSNAPALIGVSFMFLWEDRSLDELFTTIRTRMPTNAPNSLPTESYLGVLAFIMKVNGFPAGANELRADPAALSQVLITANR